MTRVYLRVSRTEAMVRSITKRYGLEVPIGFEIPTTEFLQDTTPKFPMKHDTYFDRDGGWCWPDRWVLSY